MRNNWNLLIVCFLCVLCFRPYQVNAQVQSQKKITIEISNERLPSVLKRLEKLSGYKILFTYDDVKKFTVSGSVKDKSIEQTLDISHWNIILKTNLSQLLSKVLPNRRKYSMWKEWLFPVMTDSRSLVQPLSSKEVSPVY